MGLAGPAGSQGDGGPQFASDDIVNSTVRVVAYDASGATLGWGAGWIISAADESNRAGNAIVITTAHTLVGANRVQIFSSGGEALPARMRSVQRETRQDFDVAYLEVKGLTDPALKVAEDLPDGGRPVYASGYSEAADQSETARIARRASMQSGTLAKVFAGGMTILSQAPVDQIEHNLPLAPGYSGGPLVDFCGRVIGLNTTDGGYIKLGQALSGDRTTNFALSSNELISVAGREGVPIERVPGGACATAAAPPMAANAAAPVIVAEQPPAPATGLQGVGDYFRAHPLYLFAVVIVALAALGLGLWLLLSGQKKPVASGVSMSGSPAPAPAPVAPAPTQPMPVAPVIEMVGRGPDGSALNFRFSADDLAGSPVKFGSDPSATARIDKRADYKVSGQHASLSHDGRNFVVEDLKSTNGTKVGGVKLAPHKPQVVMHGDEVEFADVKFRISIR